MSPFSSQDAVTKVDLGKAVAAPAEIAIESAESTEIKMPSPSFTPQDAQNLIAIAQNAPLQNLKAAEQVSALLQRFATWYEFVSNPQEATQCKR